MAVRNESVRLTLEDAGFSTGMAKAAASTAVLNKSLHDLDGTNVRTTRSVRTVGDEMDVFTKKTRSASPEIDRFSGRLTLLRDVAITLGPSLVPIGAAVVPMIAGLAAQLGAAAGAAGVAVIAFQGVGDALGAVNDYQLEPSQANLEKLTEEFAKIGPAGADFVLFLDSIGPQLKEIQNIARAGLLPGVQDGIESLLTMGPQLNRIVQEIAGALGEMSANAGAALSSERFADFFDYIESTAGPALMEMGRTLGNVTEGLANMMVAFHPAASDFTGGLEAMTRSFAEWSRGLEGNDSFQSFLDYVRESGPAVVDLLGSLIDALAGIVQAAAPVGAVVVPALTAVADAFAAISRSPIGTPILAAAAAFVALNRAMQIGSKLYGATARGMTSMSTAAGSAGASMTKFQKAAAGLAILEIAILGVKGLEGAMRDALPTAEQLTSRLLDLNEGSVANLGEDFTELGDSIGRLTDSNVLEKAGDGLLKVLSLGQLEGQRLGDARVEIELLDEALTDLVARGGPDMAREAFANLAVAQGLSADEQKKLLTLLPGYTDGLESAATSARLNGDATGDMSDEIGGAASNLERLRGKLQAARTELKESRQAARDVAGTFVNLGDSLNDSEKSLGDWLGELEKNAQALRDFQRNAKQAGEKGLDKGLVESLRNAGSEGALRMRQLANATDAEIERANKAWRNGQGAVKDFVKEVGGVKPKYVTKLEAQVEEAMADLARLRAQLNIPDETVNINVVTRYTSTGTKASSPGYGPVGGVADGGTIAGQREPYGDKHLYMLAPGEEVISNRHGQADRHRSLLKAINAGRLADGGTVRGLANGGTASRSSDSQLFGLNSNWLSAAELGMRIASLSQRQIAQIGRDLERLGKGPLTKLSKAFDKATEMADKELQASKDRLSALRDERDSIAATVKSRLQTADLFGQSTGNAIQFGLPENFGELSPEQQKAHFDAQWSVNQSLGLGQSQSPVDILRADLERARQEREMIRELKKRGLSGSALQYAIESDGGLEGAMDLSGKELRQFERLYDRRDRVSSSVGEMAGMAVVGQELRAARREAREDREISQAIRQEARDTNRRLERLEKLAEKNPKDTGSEVGKAVNGAAASGQRRRS